ncbi:MAG TPA: imelysin family protein, partial [Leptospiraceae bacterium]|nr:imelysin family protein [Leptospiraceae bacterium]
MVKNITENIMYPWYKDLDSKTKDLRDSILSLSDSCGGNTSNLDSTRKKWKDAFAVLKQTEVFQIGPSTIFSQVDSWPAQYTLNPPNTGSINSFISGTGTIGETEIAARPDSETGFTAIEYILYDSGSGSSILSDVCSVLTGRRKSYLQEISKLTYNRAALLAYRWNPALIPSSSTNYGYYMQNPGIPESSYLTMKAVRDDLILNMDNLLEKIKDDKLGYPAGLSVSSGGTVRPDYRESRFSDNSATDILNNILGFETFYTSGAESSFSMLTAYYNPELNGKIIKKISEVKSSLSLLNTFKSDLNSGNRTN